MRFGRAVHDGADLLHVRVPAPLRAAVRVAEAHAEDRLLAAHVADGCHGAAHLVVRIGNRRWSGVVQPGKASKGSSSRRTGRSTSRCAAMATLDQLGAADLRQVVLRFRDALRAHQEELNRLNVYPVPDGDTGTNMALTLESVVRGARRRPSRWREVCQAISRGLAHGRPRQLGRDPLADPAGLRRHLPRARRASAPATIWPRRCAAPPTPRTKR